MSKSCHVVRLRMARLRDICWPLYVTFCHVVNTLDEALPPHLKYVAALSWKT